MSTARPSLELSTSPPHPRPPSESLALFPSASSSSSSSPPAARPASLLGSIFNLTNTILGAGMLGLPSAIAHCGYAVGAALLLGCAAASALGLYLLHEAGRRVGNQPTLGNVAERAFHGCGVVVDSAILLKCFGVATAYLIVIGDSIPLALEAFLPAVQSGSASEGFADLLIDRRTWIICAALLVSPLVFLQRLDALRHTSLLALACVVVVTALIVSMAGDPSLCISQFSEDTGAPGTSRMYRSNASHLVAVRYVPLPPPAFSMPPHLRDYPPPIAPPTQPALSTTDTSSGCDLHYVARTSWSRTVRVLPIFIFAFTCHQNLLSVTGEMGRPTSARVTGVVASSVGISLIEYALVAAVGYTTFGDSVSSDLLASYPHSRVLGVARFTLSVVVALSYPLQSHPSLICLLSITNRIAGSLDRTREASVLPEGHPHTSTRRAWQVGAWLSASAQRPEILRPMFAALFLAASTAVALQVTSLGLVLAAVGATGSTIVTYIVPGGAYVYLTTDRWHATRVLALIQLLLGLIIMPTCLTLIFVT